MTRHPKFDRSKHRVTLLEATDHLAPGASGYAGGLLGLWAYPESLAGLSFRLHSELAAEHGGAEKWGYRRLPTYQVYGSVTAKQAEAAFKKEEEESADAIKTETDSKAEEPDVSLSISGDGQPPVKKAKVSRRSSSSALPPADLPEGVDWLDPEVMSGYSSMGDAEKADTAQVHPRLFTQAIAGLARAAGVDIRLNCKVTKILYAARSKPAENDPASSDPAGRPAAPATPSPAPATPEDTEEAEGGTDSPPIQAAAAASSSFGNILQGLEYVDRATNKTHRLSVHSTENNGSSESESDVVTDVVVCAGPWTSTLVPRSNVDGLRVHSILYEADLSPNALFCYVTLPSGWVAPHRVGTVRPVKKRLTVDPEIYPRPDGTVYACGKESVLLSSELYRRI